MSRADRVPKPKRRGWHTLATADRGANRFIPGNYICSCGLIFTSIGRFESHRADVRRQERERI